MKEKRWMKRSLIAAMVIIAALFCCAAAGAEPAPDITRNCKFNAGSGRKTFSKCKDRDYKTYWRTNNGDKCYVEVTVPAGQSASGVMVQWYEHPHAWGVQVKDESGNGQTPAIRTAATWRNTFPCRKEPRCSGSQTPPGKSAIST